MHMGPRDCTTGFKQTTCHRQRRRRRCRTHQSGSHAQRKFCLNLAFCTGIAHSMRANRRPSRISRCAVFCAWCGIFGVYVRVRADIFSTSPAWCNQRMYHLSRGGGGSSVCVCGFGVKTTVRLGRCDRRYRDTDARCSSQSITE